jgi:fatty-acyl-CoA synthase
MLAGQMMNTQLTITSIMEHADKVYPDSEIVSLTSDNGLHRYTYADSFIRIRKLANALANSGVEQGDRIATLAWNDYRHLELYYAISCSGAVCHTINPRLFSEQIEFIVNHAQDKILFIAPEFVGIIESLIDKLPSLKKIIVLTDDEHMPDSKLTNLQSYEAYIAQESDTFQWPKLEENTASSLCYTSGTTGNPKGVLFSHRSTVLHCYGAVMPDSLNFSVHDVILPIVPMFHVNAWSIPYSAVMVGAKLVMPGAKMADGNSLSQLINGEGVTFSAGVPTIWLALLNHLQASSIQIPSLERVVVGGAACPVSIMDQFSEYGVDVIHAWGMTESSPVGTVNTLKPGMESLEKIQLDKIRAKQGRPVYGVDIKISDSHGNEQPWDGESLGEIKIRGPWICEGYYKLEQSDAHDNDGWFSTGDVGFIDKEGYMQITDRTKDVIKSGGEWISSIDLENAVMAHPEVAEAAVIGIAHSKWTERPLLVMVKNTEAQVNEQSILQFLRGKVANWWLPDAVSFVDALPHTATGKLSKKDLREQFKDYQFPTA